MRHLWQYEIWHDVVHALISKLEVRVVQSCLWHWCWNARNARGQYWCRFGRCFDRYGGSTLLRVGEEDVEQIRLKNGQVSLETARGHIA